MSSAIFPVLPGLQFDVVKQPMFNTKIQRSVNGKEYRAAFMQYPLYTFTFAYDLLRTAASFSELQELVGFFNARQGSYDNFLFLDPVDSTVSSQQFGTGDGNTTTFQLARTYGYAGFTADDVVQNPGTNAVYDNGNAVTYGAGAGNYTMGSTGIVTFGTAPVAGHTLTWTGSFYYRCRFVEDTLDFNNFMSGMWDLKQLSFVGSPQNKV